MFAASKSGSVDAKDPQFNYVTMLLHGDGTNGAQNNTFLDSSTNNFTITRNGNTTQGTFTPYGSNWSNYFASNYLYFANDAALSFGTGDFCVEAWVYKLGASYGSIIDSRANNTATPWAFYISNTNFPYLYNGTEFTSTIAITLNAWNHVAVTRSSGTLKIFVNGVQGYSATVTANLDRTGGSQVIGAGVTGGTNYFDGNISNLRVVKGSAVYTSAFTPSTTPLTAISGTSLLTCQSNRFVDNSSNVFSLIPVSSPSVQRFSPFAPLTVYNPATYGGSGYFDGTTDYLTAPNDASFDMANGDFTVELWFNPTQAKNTALFTKRASNASYSPIMVQWTSGRQLTAFCSTTGSSWGMASTTSATYPLDSWIHVAFVRFSNNLYLYVNGVSAVTPVAISAAVMTNTSAFVVGADDAAGNLGYAGYISNLRVIKGTAIYTAAFTPPTAPLTAIANTSLLVSTTNAAILDNAMMNDLETVGNAQISTSVKKYGTGSIALDGTGDYLQGPNNPNLQMGSGSFTIEMWLYTPSLPSAYKRVFGITAPTISAATDESVNLEITNTNKMGATCVVGSTYYSVTDTTDIPTNTWTHWAFVRNGSTITLYRDGTSVSSTSISGTSNWSTTFNVYVGRWVSSSARDYNGYIDDLRITKGVARYTANFTAPTTAFADKG